MTANTLHNASGGRNAADILRAQKQLLEALTKPPPDPTPAAPETEDPERYRLYRLCPCENCGATGKVYAIGKPVVRCRTCRGEGRTLDLVATATDPESVGAALVTLCKEGEFDECPFGLMDRPEGQTGVWLLKPWTPSPRNISDAGRLLASKRKR